MTFTMVCPNINEFSDSSRWLNARPTYKNIIETLDSVGVTFEYLAENPLAKDILDEFRVRSTRCITTLPELDEIWYFKKMMDTNILPDDFKRRYEERKIPDVQFKYPKATEFRVISDYIAKRDLTFKDNMRKAANAYLRSQKYIILFAGKSSLFSEIEIKEDSGITYISYDYTTGANLRYYGGTWIDWEMLVDILKMEME